MKRNFHARAYKVVYRIYSFLFLALGVYTLGFFLFSIFDTTSSLVWSDYWDIAKIVLLSMAILLLISVIVRAAYNHPR
jgi:hypothetical protein